MSKNARLIEYNGERLTKMASWLGESSAAALAIRDRETRRARGEDAVVYIDSITNMLVVGPRVERVKEGTGK